MALNSNSTHNLAVTQETHTKTNKRYVVLNDGSFAEVPDGVKPEDTLRLENRKLASREARANGTARRTRSAASNGKPKKSTNYAELVVHRAIFFNDEVMVI